MGSHTKQHAQQYGYAQQSPAPFNTYSGSQPMTLTNSQSSTGSSGSYYSQSSLSPAPSNGYGYTHTGYGGHAEPSAGNDHRSRKGSRPTRHSPSAPSPTSSSGGGRHVCLYPRCEHTTIRPYDLDRHVKTHFTESASRLDCPYAKNGFCGREGKRGFTRSDHLKEHERQVHPPRGGR